MMYAWEAGGALPPQRTCAISVLCRVFSVSNGSVFARYRGFDKVVCYFSDLSRSSSHYQGLIAVEDADTGTSPPTAVWFHGFVYA